MISIDRKTASAPFRAFVVTLLFVALFSERVLAMENLFTEDPAKLALFESKVLHAIAKKDFWELEPIRVTPRIWWRECRESDGKVLSVTEVLKKLEDHSRHRTITATTVINDEINDIGVETKGWGPPDAWMNFYFEGGGKYMEWTGVHVCNERTWGMFTPPEGERETFAPRHLEHIFVRSVIAAAKAGRFDKLRDFAPSGPALVLGSCDTHSHRIQGIGHDRGPDPKISADTLIAELTHGIGENSNIKVTPYPESYVRKGGAHVYIETTGWANNTTGWGGDEFVRGFYFVYQPDTQKWAWVELCTR